MTTAHGVHPRRAALRELGRTRDLPRVAARISVGAVAVALVVSAAAPAAATAAAPAVLVLGFLVGLPHGSVDHLVPFWLLRARPRPRTRVVATAGLGLGYVVAAAVTWVGLRRAGAVVLPLLLVVSVVHFGLGDVMAHARVTRRSRRRRPSPLDRPVPWIVAEVLARGGPVVVGPLALWPSPSDTLLRQIAPGVALPGDGLRRLMVAGVLLCTLGTAWSAARRRRGDVVVDVALLAALFAVAPPVLAFGVYFGAWHALRHTARMVVIDPANARHLLEGRPWPAVRRFLREAAVPSTLALATVVVLAITARAHAGLAGPILAALLSLTVPHVVVVAALDLCSSATGPTGRAQGDRGRGRLHAGPPEGDAVCDVEGRDTWSA